jgi:hypothetical protein
VRACRKHSGRAAGSSLPRCLWLEIVSVQAESVGRPWLSSSLSAQPLDQSRVQLIGELNWSSWKVRPL